MVLMSDTEPTFNIVHECLHTKLSWKSVGICFFYFKKIIAVVSDLPGSGAGFGMGCAILNPATAKINTVRYSLKAMI